MSGCCFIKFEADRSETSKFTPTIVVTDRIISIAKRRSSSYVKASGLIEPPDESPSIWKKGKEWNSEYPLYAWLLSIYPFAPFFLNMGKASSAIHSIKS